MISLADYSYHKAKASVLRFLWINRMTTFGKLPPPPFGTEEKHAASSTALETRAAAEFNNEPIFRPGFHQIRRLF